MVLPALRGAGRRRRRSARSWAVSSAATGRHPGPPSATFTLFVLSSIGVIPGVFDTGGVTGPFAGETFDCPVLVLQGARRTGARGGGDGAVERRAVPRSPRGVTRVATAAAVGGHPGGPLPARRRPRALCRLGPRAVRVRWSGADGLHGRGDHPAAGRPRRQDAAAGRAARRRRRPPARPVRPGRPARPDPSDGGPRLFSERGARRTRSATRPRRARWLSPADCPAYYSSSPDAFPELVFAVDGSSCAGSWSRPVRRRRRPTATSPTGGRCRWSSSTPGSGRRTTRSASAGSSTSGSPV